MKAILPEPVGLPLLTLGPEEIKEVLEHYGTEFIWLDRIEIYERLALGCLEVTQERCRGHLNQAKGYPLFLARIFWEEMAGQIGSAYSMAFLQKNRERCIPIFSGKCILENGGFAVPGDTIKMRVQQIRGGHRPEFRAEGFLDSGKGIAFWMESGYRLVPRRFFAKRF